MRGIDTDELCAEIISLMQNNFTGTPQKRYVEAKKQMLARMKEIICINRKEIIMEFNEKQK